MELSKSGPRFILRSPNPYQAQADVPLLAKLPPEIRLIIYRAILAQPRALLEVRVALRRNITFHQRKEKREAIGESLASFISLMQSCRQM